MIISANMSTFFNAVSQNSGIPLTSSETKANKPKYLQVFQVGMFDYTCKLLRRSKLLGNNN